MSNNKSRGCIPGIWRVHFKNKTMPLPRGNFFFSKMHHSPHVPGGFPGVYLGSTPGKANDKCITSERNYLSEFSTHMVYFSHSHVCVKCRKRARNFFWGGGGGCALIKAFWTVSQWVNASQIAFNTNISPTHTLCKIVESPRDL